MDSRKSHLLAHWFFLLVAFLAADSSIHSKVSRAQAQLVEDVQRQLFSGHLERIEAKLDELNETVSALVKTDDCGCPRFSQFARAQREGGAFAGRAKKRETGAGGDRSPDDNDSGSQKDLLVNLNQLASNLNTIPTASQQRPHATEDDKQAQTMVAAQEDRAPMPSPLMQSEKRLLLSLGQLQESMLSEAFDNMNLILKQQLTSFRSTLIKLSNRQMDHNYQHHVLSEQVSLMREECSLLAASYPNAQVSSSAASLQSSSTASEQQQRQQQQQQPQAAELVVQNNNLRSSDAMLVRRLSEELNESFQRSLAKQQQQVCAQAAAPSDLIDEQERHVRHEAYLAKELKQFQRRVDEIDSVVKQSALLLSKLVNNLDTRERPKSYVTLTSQDVGMPGGRAGSGDTLGAAATTLVVTNEEPARLPEVASGNAPRANLKASSDVSAVASSKSSSRWFTGSKVPNQRQSSPGDQLLLRINQQSANQQQQQQQQRCQAKTSLVRPLDCQQLRDAGANCSGQYYVFAGANSIRHVLCDMSPDGSDDDDDGGGWTLIMRRIDKSLVSSFAPDQQQQQQAPLEPGAAGGAWTRWLEEIYASQVDFGQDWTSYKGGFGALERWSEFFIGLDLLHQLTAGGVARNQPASDLQAAAAPVELQVDLVANNSQELHLRFEDFSVASEARQYELRVGACNYPTAVPESGRSPVPELCLPITRLNNTKFFTRDKLAQANCSAGPDSSVAAGGWWLPLASAPITGNNNDSAGACPATIVVDASASHAFRLTDPVGKSAGSPGNLTRHLYWPNWPSAERAEPLRQIVLKVRRQRRGVPPARRQE